MKKLTAMLLALLLLAALAVPALAAGETGTITVTGAEQGETYYFYELLWIESISDSGDAVSYKATPEWASDLNDAVINGKKVFVPAPGEEGPITANQYVMVNKEALGITSDRPDGDPALLQALADWAYSKRDGKRFVAVRARKSGNSAVAAFAGERGLYIIASSAGTIHMIQNAIDRTVADKNVKPQFEKKVETTAGSGQFASSASYNIGDEITFQLVIHATANPNPGVAREGAYEYYVQDVIPLSFDFTGEKDVTVVRKNNTEGTAEQAVPTRDYTVDFFTAADTGENGDEELGEEMHFFEIVLRNANGYLDTIPPEGADIIITYKAKLNQDAVIGDAGNVNTATLYYGALGRYGSAKTAPSIATVYTYEFGLYKTDASNRIIDNARFQLQDSTGTAIPVVKVAGKDYDYRVAVEGEEGEEIVAGAVTIAGLGNGNYKLKETRAPQGYNQLTDAKEFSIQDKNELGTVIDNVYQTGEDAEATAGGVQVINLTGAVLPSTGGIGTTIFYVVGGVLIVGAAVVLVTRSRVRKQEGEDEIDEPEDEED